jgi:hypothetical protein
MGSFANKAQTIKTTACNLAEAAKAKYRCLPLPEKLCGEKMKKTIGWVIVFLAIAAGLIIFPGHRMILSIGLILAFLSLWTRMRVWLSRKFRFFHKRARDYFCPQRE